MKKHRCNVIKLLNNTAFIKRDYWGAKQKKLPTTSTKVFPQELLPDYKDEALSSRKPPKRKCHLQWHPPKRFLGIFGAIANHLIPQCRVSNTILAFKTEKTLIMPFACSPLFSYSSNKMIRFNITSPKTHFQKQIIRI